MSIEQTATTVKIVREIAATETRMTRSLGWDSTTAAPVVAFGVEIDYCGTDYEVNSNGVKTAVRTSTVNPATIALEPAEMYALYGEAITVGGVVTSLGEHLAARIDALIAARLG